MMSAGSTAANPTQTGCSAPFERRMGERRAATTKIHHARQHWSRVRVVFSDDCRVDFLAPHLPSHLGRSSFPVTPLVTWPDVAILEQYSQGSLAELLLEPR